MSQNVSTAFKAAALAKVLYPVDKATLQTADATIYELGSSDIVSGSLSVTSKIWDDGIELGSTVASDCSITLDNTDGHWNEIDLDGATLWPYSGLVLPDETIEYVKLGTFIIDDPGRPYSQIILGASDRMILLDEDFSKVSLTFPATNQKILTAISAYCNVPLAASIATILNISYSVTTKPDSGTCRDMVGMIALLAAGFARTNRDGALEIVPLPSLSGSTNWDMPVGSRYNFKQTSDAVTVTGLIYTDTDDTVMLGTEDYALKVDKISILQADRDAILSSVWAAIDGYTYTGYTCDYPGNPAMDCGDSVTHVTMDGKTIKTLIASHNFIHGGKSTMSAAAKSKADMGYKSANARRLSAISASLAKVKRDFTAYQQMSAQVADLMTAGFGLFKTPLAQPDGSTIWTFHDKPLMADSTTLWRMTAGVFGVSTDKGVTWNAAITANGEMLVKLLTSVGINAAWLNVGTIRSIDGKAYFQLDSPAEIGMDGGTNGTLTMSPTNPLYITRPPDETKGETDLVCIGGLMVVNGELTLVTGTLSNQPEDPDCWAKVGRTVVDDQIIDGLTLFRKDGSHKYAAAGFTTGADHKVAVGNETYDILHSETSQTYIADYRGVPLIKRDASGINIYDAAGVPIDFGGGGGSALSAYPIGSVYSIFSETNPGSLFGGTWDLWKSEIKDLYTRFLMHMDGVDNGVVFIDEGGHAVEALGNVVTKTGIKKIGSASTYFDGSGSYFALPVASNMALNTEAFCFDFWIYPTEVKDYNTIFTYGGSNAGLDVMVNSDLTLALYAGGWQITAAIGGYINSWHHVALIGNGGAPGSRHMKLYWDGVLKGTWTYNYNLGSQRLFIGTNEAQTSTCFHGYIDEFRLRIGTDGWSADFTPPVTEAVVNKVRSWIRSA